MGTGTKANLRDSGALVEFQNSLEYFSGSVERLMDAVSDYLNDVKREMERHVALLEQALKKAKEDEARAKAEKEAAYDAWQTAKSARQSASYSSSDGDDGGEYERLYSMECEAENRYYRAKEVHERCIEAVWKAESNLNEGRSILNKFLRCEDDYRADYSLIYQPGGEALMRYVANYDVRESISHLEKILEVVSGYYSCPMSLTGGLSSGGQNSYQRPGKRAMQNRREEAMNDAAYRMRKERPGRMPNPDTLVRCKVCGRPFAICRCKPSILPDVK